MSPKVYDVKGILRGHLAKRVAQTKENLVKKGCLEPDMDDAPKKMAAAILRARKQTKKKK